MKTSEKITFKSLHVTGKPQVFSINIENLNDYAKAIELETMRKFWKDTTPEAKHIDSDLKRLDEKYPVN